MRAAFVVDGPLDGQYMSTEGDAGFVYRDGDRQWVYDCRERWVDNDFRGYHFVCQDKEGEIIQDVPDFEVWENKGEE